MGGPHVTEVPDEALGREGGPRHVDAVALGEADATWPLIVEDAAKGELREVYTPEDETGKEIKLRCKIILRIPWDRIELTQFDLIRKLRHGRALFSNGSEWPGKFMCCSDGVRQRMSL